MRKYDAVDVLAVVLLVLGVWIFFWGVYIDPPDSMNQFVLTHFGDWSPGLVIDGVLLLVLNRVLHSGNYTIFSL